MNPVHILIDYFFQAYYFNIILPSTARSTKGLFPSGLPNNILYLLLISSMRDTHTNHTLQNPFTSTFFTQGGTNNKDPHYEEYHTTKDIPVPFGGCHEV